MWRVIRVADTWLVRELGRRGFLLILFGLLWIAFGVGVIVTPQPRFSGPGPEVPILHLLDMPISGALWIVAGILGVTAGLTRRRTRGHDAAGFNVLLAPVMLFLLGYLWSFATWVLTGESGKETAWVSAVVWLIVCAFILLVAGWPDPDDPAVHDNGRES